MNTGKYEFGSYLYDSAEAMTLAACESYLSADGMYAAGEIVPLLDGETANTMVSDMEESWAPLEYWDGEFNDAGERIIKTVDRETMLAAMEAAMLAYADELWEAA